jgi:hemerythrin-like domain-containing protein
MQRTQQLVPFSHDHHHGLVVCRRIQEGLKQKIDPGRIINYVRDFWLKDLAQHFEEEENLLLPLLEETNVFVKRTIEEHRGLRTLIDQMSEEDDEAKEPLLTAFADLLKAHIRFEERELFPLLEQKVNPERLTEVTKSLESRDTKQQVWHDTFWKS